MKPIEVGDIATYSSHSSPRPGETIDWVDAETGKCSGRAIILPEIKEMDPLTGLIFARARITELDNQGCL